MKKDNKKDIKIRNSCRFRYGFIWYLHKLWITTKEPHDKDIEKRLYYVACSEQLCANCYYKIYGKIGNDK